MKDEEHRTSRATIAAHGQVLFCRLHKDWRDRFPVRRSGAQRLYRQLPLNTQLIENLSGIHGFLPNRLRIRFCERENGKQARAPCWSQAALWKGTRETMQHAARCWIPAS